MDREDEDALFEVLQNNTKTNRKIVEMIEARPGWEDLGRLSDLIDTVGNTCMARDKLAFGLLYELFRLIIEGADWSPATMNRIIELREIARQYKDEIVEE